MKNNPLVSIVIPVYKGKPFLKEAIDSCLGQTYKNIEIIVVNDGSPDNGETREIANQYGDKIRYFEKSNGGVSTALNYGIKQMKGDWFSWLSHDDLYDPDKIKHQIDALSEYDFPVCVVRCSTSSMNEKGDPIFRPQRKLSGHYSGLEMLNLHSLKEVGLYGCTLLIHKNILKNIGDFSEDLKTIQDEEYWTKIMFEGYRFISIPESLVRIRVHKNQTTNLLSDRFAIERKIFVNRFIKLYKSNKDKYFAYMMILLYKQYQSGRRELAEELRNELKLDPAFRLKHKISCLQWSAYAKLYGLTKRIYRSLIVKRNR